MYKNILITGGAGYIGSHTCYLLTQLGYNVVIIDKFIHGQNYYLSSLDNKITLIKDDFSNPDILDNIFNNYKIDAVIHFAALIEVGESVKYPQKFYENNVVKTLKLLDSMLKYNIKKIIFSSSCAIYGNPIKLPLDESHPKDPISPYGKNKLTVEFILQDYAQSYNLKYISLRYFNACGALPEQNLGEQHNPETHIIPLLLRALKNNTEFKIFGTDYNTPDGTCIRDYIHVLDIAQAHILALKYLQDLEISNFFNLGTGTGFSVKEIINKAEQICNKKLKINYCARRPGDVDILVANLNKAQNILGWVPKYSSLENIIKSAWEWENRATFLKQDMPVCEKTH